MYSISCLLAAATTTYVVVQLSSQFSHQRIGPKEVKGREREKKEEEKENGERRLRNRERERVKENEKKVKKLRNTILQLGLPYSQATRPTGSFTAAATAAG